MTLFSIITLMLFSGFAKADVAAFFPNNQALLLVQGQDVDADTLFDSMKVLPTDDGTKLTKQVTYENMYAEPVFDLTCNKAKLAGIASCTLKFFAPGSVVNKEQKSILMGVNDRSDAPMIANKFNDAGNDPHQRDVFRSANGKLRIWKTFDSSGNVASFTISYF